ncbi:MAG: DMT family transporter [Anaerolineae bacterium]|jgi:drug/metabolite transporter (DMT)-like permease|nr:DMT family transporter [Anaerolineae bacterium]MBT7072129.1 DMT family transporter [Anaerolineae bacterium]MBT7326778.1 DMT family transporter [Anaerolineae bacterium]
MPLSKKTLSYIALAIAIVSMGTSAILVRWADAPGPVTAFYRVFLATIILTPFFLKRSRESRKITKSILIMPLLGGLFTAFDLALWNTSLFYTTAGNATLLVNTNPLWVALGAWLIFREKLSKDFWVGLAIALFGAALVVGGDFLIHPRLGIGDLIAISAGFFYAGYFLTTQRGRENLHPITYIWIIGLSASIGLALINLVLGNSLIGYSSQTWGVFWTTALVSQVIGYLAVSYALGHLPASVVAPTMIGQPIMTTLFAIPLLGEIPLPLQIVGGVTALIGIFLVNRAYQKGKENSEKPVLDF